MNKLAAQLILGPARPAQVATPTPQTAGNATIARHMQSINNDFVIDVVTRIDSVYHFHNLLFYISEKLNLNSPAGSEFFKKFWKQFPLVPRIIVRNNRSSINTNTTIKSLISTPSLVMVFTTHHSDPIMEVASETLKGIRWLKTIFILFPYLSSANYHESFETFTQFSQIFQDVLRWSWTKQFTNTLLLTINDNVYQLNPYPTQHFVNRTEHWMARDFFQKLSHNMMGYVVNTPVFYDMPRVFKGADQRTVYGTSGKLFLGFLDFVNATMHDTSANLTITNFNLPYLLELVGQGVYETLIHTYTDLLGNYSVSFSYPIGINDWCLMVPYRNDSVQELYVREALQENVWLLLFLTILYVGFGLWLCSPQRPRDLSAILLQCILSLINSPPTSIVRTRDRRMRYLYLVLSIMGIVASNMYISKMASYFTSPPPVRQLNTLQDVIDANLIIYVQDFEYKFLDRKRDQYSERFLQQLVVADAMFIQRHRDLLNASYGYFVSSDRWDLIMMLQKHLRVPVFRLTQICSGPFYHVFPMHMDSHLQSPLQNFILISQESGLRHHWKVESFWEALYMRVIHFIILHEQPQPLSMAFLSSMMRTWCMGLVLAGMAFILEMKWHQHVMQAHGHMLWHKLRTAVKRRRSCRR
ncbi:uncharacterized protein LOC6580661 [Drosophila mojavensis]|uniref:Ionotropic glutamate receptor C-terminal domain-containing protein n=1 Tax=Drosophila mojavensis TaxID=7230 RepID=B4KRJ0_DROMO|nr:uncharacterized protein LOC6580661 [Drosophila mojavensis]EDW10416.1 uncharacterized protein Dmoj_GI18547 [Drosophila mojavensis]